MRVSARPPAAVAAQSLNIKKVVDSSAAGGVEVGKVMTDNGDELNSRVRTKTTESGPRSPPVGCDIYSHIEWQASHLRCPAIQILCGGQR